MSKNKLKPRPFCRAKQEDGNLHLLKLSDGGWAVNHYCETDNEYELGVTIDVYGTTKEKAIEAWNRRTPA